MKPISIYLLLIALAQAGCNQHTAPQPQTKHVIDLRTFRVEASDTWKNISGTGYDSQVGHLTNGRDVLAYDYGFYSYALKNETAATHLRTVTTIDGYPALIVRPKKAGQGIIGLYVEAKGGRLNLIGRDVHDETTVISIFQSVKF